MHRKIILEGGDGCGKTTLARIVSEIFDYNLIEIPNDNTGTGPFIREWLNNKWGACYDIPLELTTKGKSKSQLLNAIVFQSLQTVNRLECLPAMRNEESTVFSRSWQSSYVYGVLDGLDPEFVLRISEVFRVPSLNILLDVSPDVSRQRVLSRGQKAVEVYEAREGFAEKVIDTYKELWERGKGLAGTWVVIDADSPLERVCARVMYEICKDTFVSSASTKVDSASLYDSGPILMEK